MTATSLALDTPELARTYEELSVDRQYRAGQQLLAALALRPGEHVLDVGSGTGLLAEHAAGLVAPGGRVVGIDPLPLRVEIANERRSGAAELAERVPRPPLGLHERRTDNLHFEVGDANALTQFAAHSFDAVYLNAVFHWLPEKQKPLSELWRVLKPGGRLALSTGERGKNTLRVVRRTVLSREPFKHFTDANDDVGHNVTADELRALLAGAGFDVRRLDALPYERHHPSARVAVEFAQASSFGNYLGRVPAPLQLSARLEIEAELDKLRTPAGVPQRGVQLIALAVKPV